MAKGIEAESSSPAWDQLCRRFSIDEIRSATRDFDEGLVVGTGGFGKVYKATLENGVVAAVKRMDCWRSSHGGTQFVAEIETLSKLRHCHLVSLIGYCNDGQEMILVYEFMPNGTLEQHRARLSWSQRLKICLGAARGLDYLHTGMGTTHGVIHRDVKSSNILLDHNWDAKISDFGLSKIGPTNQTNSFVKTGVRGTFGYIDPRYYSSGRLTRKSDVYSFGVVLFELLCGRPAVDDTLDEEQWNLAEWVQKCMRDGKLVHIVDSSIRDQISTKCLKAFARIAGRCLDNDLDKRPTMGDVVFNLGSIVSLPERMSSLSTKWTFKEKMLSVFPAQTPVNLGSVVISVQDEAKPSRSRKGNHNGNNNNIVRKKDEDGVLKEPLKEQVVVPKDFPFSDIQSATQNFSPELWLERGRYGNNFKGWIDGETCAPLEAGAGMPIVVKDITPCIPGRIEDIQLKVKFLGGLNHPNLVRIMGYCHEDNKFLVVYEYMPRGCLESHLYESPEPLPWDVRLKIAIGAARGLAFLHNAEKQIVYRRFKSSDILLDGEFNAKLSIFGLEILDSAEGYFCGPNVEGRTAGYAASGYHNSGRLDAKSDVYGFGVMLLELLMGQHAIDPNRAKEMRDLVHWAWPFLTVKHKVKSIMDRRIGAQYPRASFLSIVPTVIQRCLCSVPKNRPSMKEVVEMLEQCDQ